MVVFLERTRGKEHAIGPESGPEKDIEGSALWRRKKKYPRRQNISSKMFSSLSPTVPAMPPCQVLLQCVFPLTQASSLKHTSTDICLVNSFTSFKYFLKNHLNEAYTDCPYLILQPKPPALSSALSGSISLWNICGILIYSIISLLINLLFFCCLTTPRGPYNTRTRRQIPRWQGFLSVCSWMYPKHIGQLFGRRKHFVNIFQMNTCVTLTVRSNQLKDVIHHKWKISWNLITGTELWASGDFGDWQSGQRNSLWCSTVRFFF